MLEGHFFKIKIIANPRVNKIKTSKNRNRIESS